MVCSSDEHMCEHLQQSLGIYGHYYNYKKIYCSRHVLTKRLQAEASIEH